jgi:hypothetical protein
MYVANTTKQNFVFNFRVGEESRVRAYPIASGNQIEIGRDYNPAQIGQIVTQLERFGGRPARDAKGKLDRFPGILYSLDKPIPVDQIELGHEAVKEAQQIRAAEEVTRSALGLDASQRDARTGKRKARSTSLEITQDIPRGSKAKGDEVVFGLTVSPDGSSNVTLPGS